MSIISSGPAFCTNGPITPDRDIVIKKIYRRFRNQNKPLACREAGRWLNRMVQCGLFHAVVHHRLYFAS
jgi:hypothetical protein